MRFFELSHLAEKETRLAFADTLEKHTWAIISIDISNEIVSSSSSIGVWTDDGIILNEIEKQSLHVWEQKLNEPFQSLSPSTKESVPYQNQSGVMVGYRKEDEREFFETRIGSDGTLYPNYLMCGDDNSPSPQVCIQSIFSIMNKVSMLVLQSICVTLQLDYRSIADLTDINATSKHDITSSSDSSKDYYSSIGIDELSSSLLRICKYTRSADDDSTVAFGAHTDTAFFTLGLASSIPGLEILDKCNREWVNAEAICSSSSGGSKKHVIVFIGEFMQVFSKDRYEAAAHRVVNTSTTSPMTATTVFSSTCNDASFSVDVTRCSSSIRVSCPYIVRGRNKAVINIKGTQYKHELADVQNSMALNKFAGFDGVSMKLLHKLLDMKRQKCMHSNKGNKEEWILSAYPHSCAALMYS